MRANAGRNGSVPPETAEIAALSQQYGFAGPALEKTARLLELLDAINRHADLRACLALRGGTALHWFCLDAAQRLSVDLDLVYTGPAGAPLHACAPRYAEFCNARG